MMLLLPTLFTSLLATHQSIKPYRYTSTTIHAKRNEEWQQTSPSDKDLAKSLNIEPLDDANVKLLNEVHPRNYVNPKPLDVYDLVVIGAGAGGLVSSRQVCVHRFCKNCAYDVHIISFITFAIHLILQTTGSKKRSKELHDKC